MKYLFLLITLFIAGISNGQQVPAPGTSPMQANPVHDPVRERMELSGALKDMLGQVHGRIGQLETALQRETSEKTNDLLVQQRTELDRAKAELETSLNEVNQEDQQAPDRTMALDRAKDTMERTKQLLLKMKETSVVN